MRRPWRILAAFLFVAALLFGGIFGDDLMALNDQVKDHMRLYTELLSTAHEHYGGEIKYRDLVYASIQGMLRTLDPHTSFLSREAYDQMREKQQASFYGLGIYVGMRNGQLTVITPIQGTPAFRKGMRAGDVIHAIDGEFTDSMTSDEAISRLKGPKGTDVNVTLMRPGFDDPIEMTITRAEIPQTTVKQAYMLTEQTGYMNIADFSRSTGSEVARALKDLNSQGMERLVLDLRNNGGGLLDQAIEVAEQFVPSGSAVVETRGRTESSFRAFSSSGSFEPLLKPLVVLVNGGSASASEILSGAIQDHDVGLILGEATWGKGLVQTVYNLPYGNGLALTTARYYTPSGRLIQRDYSSYWDYYTDYESTSDDEETPNEADTFKTDLGRTVYGGGGIAPDVELEFEAPPAFTQRLLGTSAYFRFQIEMREELGVTDTSWRPSDEVIAKLRTWLVENEIVTQEQVDEEFAKDDVVAYSKSRLRYEIFNTHFDLTEGHRAFTEIDNQVQKALELLDDAAALLDRRQLIDGGAQKVAALN